MTTVGPAAVTQPGPRGEWWLLDRLALAWSVLSALALYVLIGRGGWYVDDFLAFGLARRLSRPLPRNVWNVQLSHRVSTPTTLRFALDPGTGAPIEATGSSRSFVLSGSGRLTFALRRSAIAGLRVDAAAAGACISEVLIGRPVPGG